MNTNGDEQSEESDESNVDEKSCDISDDEEEPNNNFELLRKIQRRYIPMIGRLLAEQDCSICTERKETVILPNCSHYFCKDCIEKHAGSNDKCPICREEMICYLDPNTSKVTSLEKEKKDPTAINLVGLDLSGNVHLLVDGQVYESYLTPDSPFSRTMTNLRYLIVGITIGVAYFLYKGRRST